MGNSSSSCDRTEKSGGPNGSDPNRRRRIYAIYSYLPRLEDKGGDQISELGTLRSLATRFDVFYNNQLFQPALADFGFSKTEVEAPEGDYDLAYVRSNRSVFFAAKARGYPTAYLGDYDAGIYQAADAIVTHNETMKRFLQRRHAGKAVDERFDAIYPPYCSLPSDIIVLEQPGREDFRNCAASPTARRLRMKWSDDFVIGFFGRIDDECIPRTAIAALLDIRHEMPRARFVMAGRVRRGHVPVSGASYEPRYFSADEMPHAMSACDAVVGIEQAEAAWSGSNRTLEAVRCEVPFLTMPYAARIEQLGADYPLYYRTAEEFFRKVIRLRYDKAFAGSVREHLSGRGLLLQAAAMRARNAARVADFLAGFAGPKVASVAGEAATSTAAGETAKRAL